MARIVTSSYEPILGINIITTLADGTKSVKEYHIDDMIENLRYIENEEIKVISGRISKINYVNSLFDHSYGDIATIRSFFADDVKGTTMVIDKSTDYHSDLVEVPINEIIEDAGVSATRVKCDLTLSCAFKATLTDGTEVQFVVNEGDDLEKLTYMTRNGDITADVKMVAFRYSATLQPMSMVVIDNGKVKIIDFITVKSVNGVSVVLNPNAVNLTEALRDDADGYISIGAGETNQDFTIEKDAVIRGNKAGIPAKKRADAGIKDETILSGKITVAEGVNITIDGLVLTKNAYLTFKNNPNVTIQNTIIKDLIPGTGSNSFPIILSKGDPIKLSITDCYFGDNDVSSGVKMKNCLELNTELVDGSTISNNYFEKSVCRNNIICPYDVVDGATIDISNNHFELSGNGIRIGTRGNKKAVFNIENNSYDSTSDYTEYAGLLLIQPYGKQTESFAQHTININNTTHSDDYQLWYLYYGRDDTVIKNSLRPTVIVDGVVEMEPSPDTVTVKYIVDGTENSNVEVVPGSLIPSCPYVEKEGYTFVGWSESETSTEVINLGEYIVQNDLTLYAVFSEIENETNPDDEPNGE